MEALRRFWLRYFRYDWKFGLFLILLFGIPRFMLVLQANKAGTYNLAFIIFFLMWFTPLVFLTKQGRKSIFLNRPNQYVRLLFSFILGALGCAVIFAFFTLLFGHSLDNAFVYIGRIGAIPADLPAVDKWMYFLIAATPSMIFSPIGEEFLYRGVVHGSFVGRFGEVRASYLDGLAFALTHLAHFGIVYTVLGWTFLPVPAFLWVLAMFAVSQIFFRCKLFCGSLWGAVFSHAGFNFAMMYFIFYWLN